MTTKSDAPSAADAPVVPVGSPEQKDVTPPQYATGAVKQDPVSLSVAVRTNVPDTYEGHAWGVMTVDRGGHYADWTEVQGWNDLAAGA